MSDIKLYIDEDVRKLLAKVLRDRGYDALSSEEAGMNGKSDAEQLEFAISQGRAILTHNISHFAKLAEEYVANNRHHYGVLFSQQIEFGELLRRTIRFLSARSAEQIMNMVDWLNNYKRLM